MRLHLIVILVVSLFLVLFTFQNPHPVQLQFMGWGAKEFPLIAVILVSVLGGVIVSTVLGLKSGTQFKRVIRDLKAELNELKTPPTDLEEEEK